MASFASGVPIEIRTPSPADGDPRLVARLREVHGVVAEAQPDEVGLGRRDAPAVRHERLADPVAFLDDGLDPVQQFRLGGQRGDRGRLRDGIDAEGEHRLAHRGRYRLVPDQEADPQTRQSVGFGEGAKDRDVGPLPVQLNAVRH